MVKQVQMSAMIPEELRYNFKMAAAVRGTSQRQALINLLEDYVADTRDAVSNGEDLTPELEVIEYIPDSVKE